MPKPAIRIHIGHRQTGTTSFVLLDIQNAPPNDRRKNLIITSNTSVVRLMRKKIEDLRINNTYITLWTHMKSSRGYFNPTYDSLFVYLDDANRCGINMKQLMDEMIILQPKMITFAGSHWHDKGKKLLIEEALEEVARVEHPMIEEDDIGEHHTTSFWSLLT